MDEWQFYIDKGGKYRWRRWSANNKIVAASHQGYAYNRDCLSNAERCGYVEGQSLLYGEKCND